MFYKHTYIVFQHEAGLLFHEGKLVEVLEPGRYVRWGRDFEIRKFDLRGTIMTLPAHEITCSDGISVRAGAVANYRIVEPRVVYEKLQEAYTTAYVVLHDAVRAVISELEMEQVLANRAELSQKLQTICDEQTAGNGYVLEGVNVRDVGVSGEIKRAYGKLMVAQKEAQASLERTRAETASLRALANTANLLKEHPQLLSLRWIQAIESSPTAKVVVNPSDLLAMNFE